MGFHTGVLDGGWLGVDLFFVLSGFLITRVIITGHERSGSVELRSFWNRRFRRLLPALLVFLVGVAMIIAVWPEPQQLPSGLVGETLATLGYVANWHTLASPAGYWDTYAVESPLRHMWSLAIEEQFYVVFPLVMAVVLATRRKFVGWILALATIASWSLALGLLASGTRFERVYLGTDTRLGAITLGAFIGYLTTRPEVLPRLAKFSRPAAAPAAMVIVTCVLLLSGDLEWSAWRWTVVIGFEIAVVITLVAAISSGGLINRAMSARWLVFLGAISYGLYLWHIPVQLVINNLARDLHPLVLMTAVMGTSTVIAWCSWRFIETPLRREGISALSRLRLPARQTAVALTITSAVVAVSLIASATETVRGRTPGDEQFTTFGITALEASPTAVADAPVSAGITGLPLEAPSARQPRVLFAGDSIIRGLAMWLVDHQSDVPVETSITAHVGCGPGGITIVPNDPLFTPALVASCDRWLGELPGVAAQAAPDAVIISRFSRRWAGPDLTECDPAYRDWYHAAAENEVIQLTEATGATVVLTTIPYGRTHGLSIADDDGVDCLNEELARIAEAGHAQLVDLNGWICPDRACRITQDGVTLRPDGLHFTDEGAGVAVKWMVSQVFGL